MQNTPEKPRKVPVLKNLKAAIKMRDLGDADSLTFRTKDDPTFRTKDDTKDDPLTLAYT